MPLCVYVLPLVMTSNHKLASPTSYAMNSFSHAQMTRIYPFESAYASLIVSGHVSDDCW